MTEKTIILGAGLAGLSAAYHLGGRCEVFEKEDYPGGHCRTKSVDGFNFDEGAHVFFGNDECSRQFVLEPLSNELISHRAEIWNNYEGRRFGRYPVQANAHALEPGQATRCVLDFIRVHERDDIDVRDYRDWCRASFGNAFAEEFMFRYARKVWTVEPEELNVEWLGSKVGGRISRPSLDQVIRGAVDPEPQELNYLTEFAYPERGGFGRIAENLSMMAAPRVRTGCPVERIDVRSRRLWFGDGTTRSYDAVISTIPLPVLVDLIADVPTAVRESRDRLMWTSVRCVNLGVRRSGIGPGHWVYFYDEKTPFFRVSFPSKFSPTNAPDGCSSVSCEIAYSRRKPLQGEALTGRVVESLRTAGVLEHSDEIVLEDEIDIPFAYVVFDFNRASSLRVIHDWLESVDVYPCGRFGEWGYHWSFEAIESGKRVASKVNEMLGSQVPA